MQIKQLDFSLRILLILGISLFGLLAVQSCSSGDGDDIDTGDTIGSSILRDLVISGAKTSINPSFDPEIFRYSVVAANDSSSVQLMASADENLTISVNDSLVPSDVPESVDGLNPGSIINVRVDGTDEMASSTYTILYLPSDFPLIEATVVEDGISELPIYLTFVTRPATSGYVAQVDNRGVPYWFRREEGNVADFKRHSTGESSYAALREERNICNQRSTEMVILDESFVEKERAQAVGLNHTDNHDFLMTEDEFIFISYNGSTRDLTQFGQGSNEPVCSSVIKVVNRETREVEFTWDSWDHLPYDDQLFDPVQPEYAHINSIEIDSDGNYLASFRRLSQVVKISSTTGEVIWKFGGKSNQFEFVNDPFANLCGQHTVNRLDNGNILMLDNGQLCWPEVESRGNLSRVVEYKLNETDLTAELVWSYSQDGAYSAAAGSSQRLENGNTLVGWGLSLDDPDLVATEVDSEGRKVFEMYARTDLAATDVIAYRIVRH